MQVLVAVWALGVAFAVLVAAESSSSFSFGDSSTTDFDSPQSVSSEPGGTISAPPSLPSSDPPASPASSELPTSLASFALPTSPPASGIHTSTSLHSSSSAHNSATVTQITYYPTTLGGTTFGGLPVGHIIAASVGGSVGVSLLAIAVVFLFFRRRRIAHGPVESALDTARRCDALEAELRALRAQLARVEGRQLLSSGSAPITFTNEKDADALRDGSATKDGPPIYAD
ncbi:hypothetical protein B0H16DRAFT_156107 [Mycena metata]|uniref:Uncharacterized protein n=1 Tax=Mycena metata TaxID=1033252 RepID=A0AAD7I358_9AGAR|nr:hypothetical protein B0H16DRAFT_156107 [Mycena metata]